MAGICRVWPNHFTIPQGEQPCNNFHLHPGSPALTMKLVCQVIRFHSFYQTCQILWIIAILPGGSFLYCSEFKPVTVQLWGCCSVFCSSQEICCSSGHIKPLKTITITIIIRNVIMVTFVALITTVFNCTIGLFHKRNLITMLCVVFFVHNWI